MSGEIDTKPLFDYPCPTCGYPIICDKNGLKKAVFNHGDSLVHRVGLIRIEIIKIRNHITDHVYHLLVKVLKRWKYGRKHD